MKGIIRFFLFSCLPWLHFACDLTEPERFYNDKVRPPQIKVLDIAREITPGRHLAGFVRFEVNLDSLKRPIERVVLLVDSTEVFSAYQPPYILQFETTLWGEGVHLILVGVVERNPDLGLLNLARFPSIIFAAPVYFDQSPSTPTVLNSVIWENGHPRLAWQRNNDLNFYAYIIHRDGNWGRSEGIFIYDRATTTYLDTSISPIYGIGLNYNVAITNRVIEAPSNIVNIGFGQTLPVAFAGATSAFVRRPIYSPVRDELYFLQLSYSDSIIAVSTTNNQILRSRQIPFPANFALSADGARLFVVSYNTGLLSILDATTFDLLKSINMSLAFGGRGPAMVAGRSGRLYIAGSGLVKILNTDTNATVGEIALESGDGLLAISPDKNMLYVGNPDYGGYVYKLDITTDQPRIMAQDTASFWIRAMQLSPDGRRLYILPDFPAPQSLIEIWDAATLRRIGELSVRFERPEDRIFDFFVAFSHVYVAFSRTIPEGLYFLPGRIEQFEASSLSTRQFWDFVQVPITMVTSREERNLYVFANKSCIVPLQ
jgi:WD40 repeat protein